MCGRVLHPSAHTKKSQHSKHHIMALNITRKGLHHKEDPFHLKLQTLWSKGQGSKGSKRVKGS